MKTAPHRALATVAQTAKTIVFAVLAYAVFLELYFVLWDTPVWSDAVSVHRPGVGEIHGMWLVLLSVRGIVVTIPSAILPGTVIVAVLLAASRLRRPGTSEVHAILVSAAIGAVVSTLLVWIRFGRLMAVASLISGAAAGAVAALCILWDGRAKRTATRVTLE